MGSNPSLAIIDLGTSVYNLYVHCVYYVHVCTSMCAYVCICVHMCAWCVQGVYICVHVYVHGVYINMFVYTIYVKMHKDSVCKCAHT